MADLTAKQAAFVAHYLDCLNGAEAARRAGYAAGSKVCLSHCNAEKQCFIV